MKQPHVFLLIGDCLRMADVSGTTMPFIHRFSNTKYHRCYAPSTWTLPSHASLYAQRTPIDHDITRRGEALRKDHAQLPRCARSAGYETSLFSENPTFSGRTGFHHEIDNVHDFIDSKLFSSNFSPENQMVEDRMKDVSPDTIINILSELLSRPGKAKNLANLLYSPLAYYQLSETSYPHHGKRVISHLQSYLNERTDRPLLSIINLLDPHNPHHAPPEEAARELGITVSDEERKALRAANDNKQYLLEDSKQPPADALSHFDDWTKIFERRAAVYRTQIRHFDSLMEQWIKTMDRDLLRDSFVVVTGDHGQLFGEEEMVGHHTSLHPHGIHVPLFVNYPDSWESSISDVKEPVSWIGLSRALTGVITGEITGESAFLEVLQSESLQNGYVVVTVDGPTWNVNSLREEYDRDRVDKLAVRKIGLVGKERMYVYKSSWNESRIESHAFDLKDDTRKPTTVTDWPELSEQQEDWLTTSVEADLTGEVSSRLRQLGYM